MQTCHSSSLHHSLPSAECTDDWFRVDCFDCLKSLAQRNPFRYIECMMNAVDFQSALALTQDKNESFGPGFYDTEDGFDCVFTPLGGETFTMDEESPWTLVLTDPNTDVVEGVLCLGLLLRKDKTNELLSLVILLSTGWAPLNTLVPPGFDPHHEDAMAELLYALKETTQGKAMLDDLRLSTANPA